MSLITEKMNAAIGIYSEPGQAVVERGAIERFAAAIGDGNFSFPDIAPPTFLRSVGRAIPDIPNQESVPRVIDGGSEWSYGTVIRSGDVITYKSKIESMTEREGRMGPMLIIIYITDYINQNNEFVASQRNTLIRMPAV